MMACAANLVHGTGSNWEQHASLAALVNRTHSQLHAYNSKVAAGLVHGTESCGASCGAWHLTLVLEEFW